MILHRHKKLYSCCWRLNISSHHLLITEYASLCVLPAHPAGWGLLDDIKEEREYSHASLNDEDTFWKMRRYAISLLCERHRDKNLDSIAYCTPSLYGIAYCS